MSQRDPAKANISHEYTIELLQGNHGIWLFVKQYDVVIFEQSGFKSAEEALDFAKGVILSQEKISPKIDQFKLDSGN